VRPIDKGEAPAVYDKYEDAKPDLQNRIGRYCSYCERRVPASLAVEHVEAKINAQGLILTWENFLLACSNCNSTKSAARIDLADYLGPTPTTPYGPSNIFRVVWLKRMNVCPMRSREKPRTVLC
jgi:5-methylcytosine-specific restriction endonuclease McrA